MKSIHSLLLLDMSGSMSRLEEVTTESVNKLIKSTAKAAKANGLQVWQSLAYFDDVLEIQYIDRKISDCTDIQNYHHRGGTNIYDSVIEFIETFDERTDSDAPRVLTVFTDGEHVSNSFNHTIEEMADFLKKIGPQWTVNYVTPSWRYVQLAAASGILPGNVMQYQTNHQGTRAAFDKIGVAMKRYIEKRAETYDADLSADFFAGIDQETTMHAKGMKVVLNLPDAVKGDKAAGLPPYAPATAYVVDEYPQCPEGWEHGSAKASSYFVAVEDGQGMWLDFNGNWDNEHDVAIVLSVQGINPVTGEKMTELKLQKFENKCPIHNVDFHQDRFCPECKHKWPAQNFLSTTGTPHGQLWLDGFRKPDGTVAQYVLTPEDIKGVAYNILDKDKPKDQHQRVYAIGVAFYRSKKAKPKAGKGGFLRGITATADFESFGAGGGSSSSSGRQFTNSVSNMPLLKSSSPGFRKNAKLRLRSSEDDDVKCFSMNDDDIPADNAAADKLLEVGAGAAIEQNVYDDPNSMDYWEDEPFSMVYINYATSQKVKQILAGGRREEKQSGFLTGIPVGNL